ncbi:hypothetical protein ACFP3U_08045 [Kitasatospora misakiensis]|uniref:Uncharacterized protein n=1 Tax=Kitasatospora misakiensis TaxID=67330 RepID=A0ABW0X304_9ACTN
MAAGQTREGGCPLVEVPLAAALGAINLLSQEIAVVLREAVERGELLAAR